MSKEYVPIFFDWLETTQDLTPEEKGNLIDAVVAYASGQQYEHLLTGGCKIAFRFLKGQVDRNTAISDARSKAGSSKKQQEEVNTIKEEQNETNENKTEQTESNFPKENNNKKQKQEQKTKTKENECASDSEKRQQESLLTTRFETFWQEYPRKTDKKKALDAFRKLNPDQALLGTMLESISRWKQTTQWQEDDGRYIPHPTTWLRNRRWEDEIPASRASPRTTVVAQQYEQRTYSNQAESADDVLDRAERLMTGGAA